MGLLRAASFSVLVSFIAELTKGQSCRSILRGIIPGAGVGSGRSMDRRKGARETSGDSHRDREILEEYGSEVYKH